MGRELGLGHDRCDVLCEERRREAEETLEEPGSLDAFDDTTMPPALTAPHWPAAELDRVLGT